MFYQNGNRLVYIDPKSGTKIRYRKVGDDSPYRPRIPESLDINISYRCELRCPFWYISAGPSEEDFVFDGEFLDQIFGGIDIKGMEIALNINDGIRLKDPARLVKYFRAKGAFVNFTVNALTLRYFIDEDGRFSPNDWVVDFLDFLFEDSRDGSRASMNAWLGVSVQDYNSLEVAKKVLESDWGHAYFGDRFVYHAINGVFPPSELHRFKDVRVLILGYKEMGRGTSYKKTKLLSSDDIKILVENGNTVAFDTLALEQIGVDIDHKYYFGKDGEHSFYIDLVTRNYGVSSTSKTLFDIGDKNLLQMFKHVREVANVLDN